MARPLRIEFPGAIWHVTSRGNERRDIVRDDEDRRRFIRLLADVVHDRRWILHSWVLMTNHYHLLVETPEVGLSRGVKWLNQRYAEVFNQRYERVGHLFQGRFKGILVERETHLLELVRYLVLNPVRAGMVRFGGDYEWSNYRATAGLQTAPAWLEVDWTLAQFNPTDRVAARDEYRRFVGEARGAEYNPWEKLVGQLYLGSDAFCRRMQKLVDEKNRSREHPRRQRTFVRPSLDAVASAVATAFEVSHGELLRRSRGPARKALVHVAVEGTGMCLEDIGRSLGITGWAASKLRRAGEGLYETDTTYRAQIDAIRARLKLNFQT